MSSDTRRARSKNRMRPVPALDGGTTASRLTLIARCVHVPEVTTPRPLQKISSHARHVAKLRGGTFEQGLGNDWIVVYYRRVFCDVAHFFQCTDTEVLRSQFDSAQLRNV